MEQQTRFHVINEQQTSKFISQDFRKHSGKLFLISPSQRSNQIKRSYRYNFNNEFKKDVDEMLSNPISFNNSGLASNLMNKRSIYSAIQPDAQGFEVNLKPFEMHWTFIMFIDDLSDRSTSSLIQLSNNNRFIVSGICVDEPANLNNHGQGFIINPNCILQPTHVTMSKLVQFQNFEGGEISPQYIVDKDIFNYPSFKISTDASEKYEILRPQDYVRSSDFYYEEDNHDGLGLCTFHNEFDNNEELKTSLYVPKYHTSEILKNIISSIEASDQHRLYVNDLYNNHNFNDRVNDVRNNFSLRSQNQDVNIFHQLKLNLSAPISITNLINIVPNIDISVIPVPKYSEWDSINQAPINSQNLYSSILAQSIPSMMSSFNLAETNFRYASWITQLDGSHGEFELNALSSYIPLNNESLKRIWRQFSDMLKTDLFPILLNSIGHFDVQVSCQPMGYTCIQLIPMDEINSYNPGMYEVCNSFGGMNTPLVGTVDMFSANAIELNRLVSNSAYNYSGN